VSDLDAATLDGLRASLMEHRESLRREIAEQGIDPDSEDFGLALERGFADGGQATAERGRLLSLAGELRGSLREVEHALAEFDRGRYGICERCGGTISLERLEAIPWARLCITCKQKRA
jgi:RNA polymerase-binding transcription factor